MTLHNVYSPWASNLTSLIEQGWVGLVVHVSRTSAGFGSSLPAVGGQGLACWACWRPFVRPYMRLNFRGFSAYAHDVLVFSFTEHFLWRYRAERQRRHGWRFGEWWMHIGKVGTLCRVRVTRRETVGMMVLWVENGSRGGLSVKTLQLTDVKLSRIIARI
jgi:hypothetical protein